MNYCSIIGFGYAVCEGNNAHFVYADFFYESTVFIGVGVIGERVGFENCIDAIDRIVKLRVDVLGIN
jgi:hypothetical protein